MTDRLVHQATLSLTWLTDPDEARRLAHEVRILGEIHRRRYPDHGLLSTLLKITAETVAEYATDLDETYRTETAAFAVELERPSDDGDGA